MCMSEGSSEMKEEGMASGQTWVVSKTKRNLWVHFPSNCGNHPIKGAAHYITCCLETHCIFHMNLHMAPC